MICQITAAVAEAGLAIMLAMFADAKASGVVITLVRLVVRASSSSV